MLAAPPPDEYALLELAVDWDGLVGVDAQLAAALRLFVITRDPLDWLRHRGSAWATANNDGDTLEIPVYVARDELERRVEENGRDLSEASGPLAESGVLAASSCQGIIFAGAYPELAIRGEAPRLLGAQLDAGRLGAPAVGARSTGWEPIGLGAIQDLVQDAFGPVSLDRSAVALARVKRPKPACPACTGDRFGFPGDLAEAQASMCGAHRAHADAVTASRISRARAGNPAGWSAIAKGSARVSGGPDPPGTPMPQRHGRPHGRDEPCPCGSGRKYKQCCAADVSLADAHRSSSRARRDCRRSTWPWSGSRAGPRARGGPRLGRRVCRRHR